MREDQHMSSPENSAATNVYPDANQYGTAAMDIATAWDMSLRHAMRRSSAIIALRGAGSTGGIDPEAADHVIEDILTPRLTRLSDEDRPVVVMYDGDPDDLDKPDIGYVAGRLREKFAEQVDNGQFTFMTAQSQDWYYPPAPDSNLTNAHGLPFDTYVFPRGVYLGDHDRFTQSPDLLRYKRYGQYYIGAAGMLAANQMVDYCNGVPGGSPVNINVVRAMVNRSLDQEIGERLANAVDVVKQKKIADMIEQRKQIYGAHWGNDGKFDDSFLAEVRRPDDTHELVILWKTPEEVAIANCRKIDLHDSEHDGQFAQAGYFTKTAPIRARQVEPGRSEVVSVKSGATTDTAHEGEWVCTSTGGEEYKGPSDFSELYDVDPNTPGLYIPRIDPRKLVKLGEDVQFMTPWGELQAVLKGGYLVERVIQSGSQKGQIERYGISEADAADMRPVNEL